MIYWIYESIKSLIFHWFSMFRFRVNFRLFRNMLVHNNDVHYQSLLPSWRLENSSFSKFRGSAEIKISKEMKNQSRTRCSGSWNPFGWNTYSEHLTKLHSKLTKMTKIRIFRTKFQSPKIRWRFQKTNLKLLKWSTTSPRSSSVLKFCVGGLDPVVF